MALVLSTQPTMVVEETWDCDASHLGTGSRVPIGSPPPQPSRPHPCDTVPPEKFQLLKSLYPFGTVSPARAWGWGVLQHLPVSCLLTAYSVNNCLSLLPPCLPLYSGLHPPPGSQNKPFLLFLTASRRINNTSSILA